MKKLMALLLALALTLSLTACATTTNTETSAPTTIAAQAATRIVKGDDGKDVEIPANITKAAPLIGAFAQMTEMLTAGGGKIVAAATQNVSDYFKQVFPDYLQSNPNNYDASSVEDLIAAGAQVCYGPSSIFSDDQRQQLAAAGVAYVPIDNIATVEGICGAFQIIGDILGAEEAARAAEFVSYYKGNITIGHEKTEDVANKLKVASLFYSADAYSTINGKDICNEYIEAAGGVNVAKDYSPQAGGNSLTVDAEQIVAWNPQFIITSNQEGMEAILADPALAKVDAVANKKIAVVPFGVYLWSVRSGEGSMLPLWLGKNLYPDRFADINMQTVVKDFFNNWYGYDIPQEEIERTLAGDARTGMAR